MKKISIITPCLNMEGYIEQTICSVLAQKDRNIEYLVIDGGSTDRTMEIIDKYAKNIDIIVSEKDAGQYSAIQKGVSLASGDIIAWLNADDVYMPWALRFVQNVFDSWPDIQWIIGLPTFLNENGEWSAIHSEIAAYPKRYLLNGWFKEHLAGYLQQESMFWRKSLWNKVGGLDLSLNFAADFDLWTRFAIYADLVPANIPLASFRIRPGGQKSSVWSEDYLEEVDQISLKLRKPPVVWDLIARRGVVARSLCRSIIWKKGLCIAYSQADGKWVRSDGFRSLSKVSIRQLILEKEILNHSIADAK